MKTVKIIFEFIVLVVLFWLMVSLSGCRSVAPVVTVPRNDSIVLRHEILHDSIYIDRIHLEIQKGDTVYLRDTVTQKFFSIQNTCDTIYKDKEVIIQPPPEKYIPKFYKWCTGLFWLLVVLIVGYTILRIVIKIYLKK